MEGDDAVCASCGRHIEDAPGFGLHDGPRCEQMSAHHCGYPVPGDKNGQRPWGHSAYDGIGHSLDRDAHGPLGGGA